MADDPRKGELGLPVRLIANVLTFTVLFGALFPLGKWILGDGRGFGDDLREGLLTGAGTGVLMTFLGDPLARWLDGLLRGRRGGEKGGP